MLINEYQMMAMTTRTASTYPEERRTIYPTLGLTGEAGEVADKVKKVLRDKDGVFSFDDKREIALELGDVMWYAAALAADLGFTLEEIANMNLKKLADRNMRGMIHGKGDHR